MDVVSPILLKAGASCVINKLFDVATTYVRDQYYWETDLLEELQSLKRRLPQIQAIVGFAEERLTMYESSDPALKEWLCQFRDGIEEAEEVLDDMEYLELEKKVNSDKSMLSRTVDASVKAAKRLLKCDDVLGRLKTCVKNLNTSASASDVQNFLTLVTQKDGNSTGQMEYYHSSRITNPLPVLSFKGREEEKEKIIQYLLGESVEKSKIQISENVHCLPLVAMGGMGKTALAQQVFDYFENVKKEHFDITIWVCDSLPVLNASSLMKKILEYSTRQFESGPLELIPVKLKEKLHSKRFLLVLDDAWDDKNQIEWEKLCAPLLYGQKGSWIILTTRLESVARMTSKEIRGTMEPMMLQGLSKDECRSLLYDHAFVGQDPNEFPLLKKIGEEIVEKLHGVPLLAKSIGGALYNKLEVDHWTSISTSELWKTSQDSKYEFIPALTLSYMMLPSRLKRCFSYCSIFPQDYKFNKQKLVCMWVAAGLIYLDGSEAGSDEEDIANCCFDMLCNKSFFDFHTTNLISSWYDPPFYYTASDYYTMHDMLNSLACHVSRYECCRIVYGTRSYILDSIRHLSIASTAVAQLHDLTKMVCKLQHLRTLWIQYDGDSPQLLDFIPDVCKSSRRIRVFIMNSNSFKISYQYLKSISDFVKLRFLDMSGFGLPLSLSKCKFYFLQVIIRLRLSKDANKLTNLRHLYEVVDDDALFSVAEVGKLTSLQELCFAVGTEPGYRIDELMNMDNLRKLSIRQLSNVRSLEEAKMVNLVKKRDLTRLELCWNEVSNPGIDHQEVLAALQPSPAIIRELIIREYKGGRPAPWMDTLSLSRLEYLKLDSCTSWEELPPLWKLPCLKFLTLYHMKAIRSLGCHFSDGIDIQFPVLEELEFWYFPLWEEWHGADDYIWFPHLKSFQIYGCPKLKKIPDLPLSIEKLYIQNVGLEALPRSYTCSNGSRTFGGFQQLMSLRSLRMCNSSKIVQIGSIGEEDDNILPSSLKELRLYNIDEHKDLARYLRGLTSLIELYLSCSQGMTSLPLATELEHLTTLRSLDISGGETLTSPGGLYILKSLKELSISNCPKFLSAEVESQEFLKDKTRKHAVSSSSVFDHSASNIAAASILPSSLEFLYFENSDISQESLGRCLQGLTSLKKLTLSDCHHLVSLPNKEYLHNLTVLQELNISNCKELCELQSLTTLASLEKLRLSGCHHLVSLPNKEYLHNLTALKILHISDCKELCELESLTALASLRELHIKGCPKLLAPTFSTLQNPATTTEQSATKKKKGTLPSLEEIEIDNIFYLSILPNPEKLKTLEIENFEVFIGEFISSEIEEWLLQCQNSLEVLRLKLSPHLQLLPASLERFSSLKVLNIRSARKLESLPRMPASLERLTIDGCNAKLKKRCQENIGRDWPNIKHIREILIRADEEDEAEAQVNCNCVSSRFWSST